MSNPDIFPLLITGITGVAGFNAFHYLRQRYPGQVIIGTRPRQTWRLCGDGVAILDAEDRTGMRELFGEHRFRAVLNCVGNCALKSCELDPAMARLVNVASAEAVIECICQHGCRLVHLSSDLVYSGNAKGNYVETDPTDPVTIYGKTMVEAEELIAANSAGGGHPAHLAADGAELQPPRGGHRLDPIALPRTAGRRRCTSMRCVPATYCDDLNRVFERFLHGNEQACTTSAGRGRSRLYQIAQIVNRVGGYDPALLKGCPRRMAGPMPPRAGNVSMCSDKLVRLLGVNPLLSWPVGEEIFPTDRYWHFTRPRGMEGSPHLLNTRLYRYSSADVNAAAAS